MTTEENRQLATVVDQIVNRAVNTNNSIWREKLQFLQMFERRANDSEDFKQGYNTAVREFNKKLEELLQE